VQIHIQLQVGLKSTRLDHGTNTIITVDKAHFEFKLQLITNACGSC